METIDLWKHKCLIMIHNDNVFSFQSRNPPMKCNDEPLMLGTLQGNGNAVTGRSSYDNSDQNGNLERSSWLTSMDWPRSRRAAQSWAPCESQIKNLIDVAFCITQPRRANVSHFPRVCFGLGICSSNSGSLDAEGSVGYVARSRMQLRRVPSQTMKASISLALFTALLSNSKSSPDVRIGSKLWSPPSKPAGLCGPSRWQAGGAHILVWTKLS